MSCLLIETMTLPNTGIRNCCRIYCFETYYLLCYCSLLESGKNEKPRCLNWFLISLACAQSTFEYFQGVVGLALRLQPTKQVQCTTTRHTALHFPLTMRTQYIAALQVLLPIPAQSRNYRPLLPQQTLPCTLLDCSQQQIYYANLKTQQKKSESNAYFISAFSIFAFCAKLQNTLFRQLFLPFLLFWTLFSRPSNQLLSLLSLYLLGTGAAMFNKSTFRPLGLNFFLV